jgi:hypothetical protein
MHERESAAWLARLHHVLVVERYGFSRQRSGCGMPIAAKTRTIRHLARQSPADLDAVLQTWPDIQRLPIWPDLKATFDRVRRGPAPAPMTRRRYVQGPASSDPLARMRELVRRLVYLHDEEELSGDALGSLTASEAWREAMVELLGGQRLAMLLYLDLGADPTSRLILRFYLRTRRVLDHEWRTLAEHEVLAAFARTLAREPGLLADTPPEQLERLRAAGLLPVGSIWAGGDLDVPLAPLDRVPSSHFERDYEPALLTMAALSGK